jgi:hypothetical protein
LFWYSEWRYSLPTPVPADYKAVKTGEIINVNNRITSSGKPVFFHFFNPDCPCSRLNITEFKSLVRKYGNKLNFIVVVMTENKDYTSEDIRKKYDINLPVLWQLDKLKDLSGRIKNNFIIFILSSSIDPADKQKANDNPMVRVIWKNL